MGRNPTPPATLLPLCLLPPLSSGNKSPLFPTQNRHAAGLGGGLCGGSSVRDDRAAPETEAERRARIVRSEAAKKRAVHKYTNWGVRQPPSLAPYANYGKGASSSSHRHRRTPTRLLPPPPPTRPKRGASSPPMTTSMMRRRRRGRSGMRWPHRRRRRSATPRCRPSRPSRRGRLPAALSAPPPPLATYFRSSPPPWTGIGEFYWGRILCTM
jgi:hypothetical protein